MPSEISEFIRGAFCDYFKYKNMENNELVGALLNVNREEMSPGQT